MRKISINTRAACAYLLVLVLVYLAGSYVGSFYYYLYAFMVVLPIYSIVQVAAAAMSLRCVQTVDIENPVKGDLVRYRMWVSGKPFLTATGVVRFMPLHSRLSRRVPDLSIAVTGSRFAEESFDIRLSHRGSYTIGTEYLLITDPLGWLTVRREGSCRRFDVRPRILPLVPPAAETRVRAVAESGVDGVQQDLTMFEGLADYRGGEPVKQIAWKKYFQTGAPYLKLFGGSSEPAVIIYLDLRLPAAPAADDEELRLTTEDCSIETAISLVKGYLDREVRVEVRTMGQRPYSFLGGGPADFSRFYEESDGLLFCAAAPSPSALYEAGRSVGAGPSSVVFVSHRSDDALFEAATERSRRGERTALCLNLTAMCPAEREHCASYGRMVESTDSGMYFSVAAASLEEDLARMGAVAR